MGLVSRVGLVNRARVGGRAHAAMGFYRRTAGRVDSRQLACNVRTHRAGQHTTARRSVKPFVTALAEAHEHVWHW